MTPAHGGGPRDESDPSWFAISHRSFHVAGSSGKKVLAVELTWSGLTQWLKVKQLGFDLTQDIVPAPPLTGGKKPKDEGGPVDVFAALHGMTFTSSGVKLNRVLKEDVLDRSLADALLYIGDNGSKINQAMSEIPMPRVDR